MAYDSFDAAAEALAAANRGGESAPDPTPAPEQAVSASAPEVDAGTTEQSDSFANIDPNALPPELRSQYQNMQGAFTRRMQEVSEMRKQYESLGDFETAQQAVQLVQALQEDPVAVHRQLTDYLESIGHSPAQAQAIASEQTGVQSDGSSFFDEEADNGPLNAVQRELEELKQWKEQQEMERQEQAEMAALQREEMAIREADPSLSDDDIQTMYQLAFAHGGSLVHAAEAYKALRDRLATSFLEQKASVPAGVSSPTVTGTAQQPARFSDLNDPELEKAVAAYYNAGLS